jgi:hypothetical protein
MEAATGSVMMIADTPSSCPASCLRITEQSVRAHDAKAYGVTIQSVHLSDGKRTAFRPKPYSFEGTIVMVFEMDRNRVRFGRAAVRIVS